MTDIARDRAEERSAQQMKHPTNTSKEAVALRKAAIAFADHVRKPARDPHDRVGARLNGALLRAARAYAKVFDRYQRRVARLAPVRTPPVILRIQSTSEEKAASWIERYYLRDIAGRYRERRDIPGNGQYAPGDDQILAWFRAMGVTHVEVAPGWHDSVPAATYTLRVFARHLRRVSKEAE